MELANLKRWHWMVIALLVGAALALINDSTDWSSEPGGMSMTPMKFVIEVDRASFKLPGGKTQPSMSDIKVYPARQGYQLVRGTWWTRKNASIVSASVYFDAPVPFRILDNKTVMADSPTVVTFLKDLQKTRPDITLRYAWWRETRWNYALWLGGSFLAIGVIWPVIVDLIVGAGFARRKEKVEKLPEHWGKGKEEAKPVLAANGGTGELDNYNEDLEQQLAKYATARKSEEDVEEQEAVVRKLDAAPLTSTETKTEAEKAQEYTGEFYPVVRGGGKANDEE